MRFQIKLFLAVFCLVSSGLLFLPALESANAQLPQCTCDNSFDSVCADGFLVTFEGRVGNTFTYSICNVDTVECNAPMALSHADIIITNPLCIGDPGADITTTIIGTDGSTRACDAPTDKDKSCGFDNLSELLIKCDNTNGVFEPGPGQCIEIDIEIANTPGITVGPSIALNKAGNECGIGCLLGPSCEGCGPPPENPCQVTVVKELNNSDGPASFGYFVDFSSDPPVDFNQVLSPPNTPSFMFNLPQSTSVTVTEDVLPPGWSFNQVVCSDGGNIVCTENQGNLAFTCTCNDPGDSSAICTFTNDPPPPGDQCDIIIKKETDPDGSQTDFDFTSTQGDPNFSLLDGEMQMIDDVDLGILVVVQEFLPTDWVLDNIVCVGGDQSQFIIDVDGDQLVRITCDDSTDVTRTCTFFNRFDPPPPGTGCCIESQGMCMLTLADNCPVPPNEAFLGVGASCDDPRCETPPPGEGCCVESEGECSITIPDDCPVPPNEEYLGIGSICDDPRCETPISRIPTIGQWGMIAMAGLLGIFSLFIIMRRHRYNVS